MKIKAFKSFLLSVLVLMLFVPSHCFANDNTNKFIDVPSKEWYAESINYVHENGLMNGISETTFEPETSITRGMIVTIIYRLEGSPNVDGTLTFFDVNESYYYRDPIIWAAENEIVNGIDNEHFAPDSVITREQFATIIYRYSKYKNLDMAFDVNLEKYEDAYLISDYAKDAMSWVNDKNLITGVTSTTLVPQGVASRAQAATIFMRFDKLVKEALKEDEDKDSFRDEDENIDEWDDVNDNNSEAENNVDDSNEKEDDLTSGSDSSDLPTICVEDAVVKGKYADIVISVINNPGIASIKFDVEFDSENLELVSVKFDSMWGDYVTAPTPYNSPQTINLISPFENITASGTLATLRFAVLDNSFDGDITLKCDNKNIFDSNFNDIKFTVKNGKIKK